jgi:hypothetical protein
MFITPKGIYSGYGSESMNVANLQNIPVDVEGEA